MSGETKRLMGMSKRILVIDDDQVLSHLLEMRLKAEGFSVRTTLDALTAVREAHVFEPDLIILDLILPGGNGISVIQNLRSSTHTREIPIMAITGIHDDRQRQKFLELGARAYLEKPYETTHLLAEIARLLELTQDQVS